MIAMLGFGSATVAARTFLEDAARESIELLVARRPRCEGLQRNGQTALHGAAGQGANSIVQYLVDRGAELDVKDKQGRTPLDVALGVPAAAGAARRAAVGVGPYGEDGGAASRVDDRERPSGPAAAAAGPARRRPPCPSSARSAVTRCSKWPGARRRRWPSSGALRVSKGSPRNARPRQGFRCRRIDQIAVLMLALGAGAAAGMPSAPGAAASSQTQGAESAAQDRRAAEPSGKASTPRHRRNRQESVHGSS